jgi:hypothetical protein
MPTTSELSKQLSTHGFAVLRRFEPTLSSSEAFACLGVVDKVEGLNPVQSLRPCRVDEAPPNTYSGNFGTADFPLHTDLAHWAMPPRYFALRCVRGASDVATRILDANALITKIGVDVMRRILVQPRRPMCNGKQLLHLLERTADSGEFMLRWDSVYLRAATNSSKRILADVLDVLSSISTTNVILIDTGDTLIIDNWHILHGRTPTPEHAWMRHIDRSYFKEIW